MKRLSRPKFIGLTAILAIASLAIGGSAYGYWRATGTGTGSGTTGTTVAISLGAATPTSSLYPGGQANVVLNVTNTNDSIIHISTLSLDTTQGTSGYAVDAGHSGCAVAALTYSVQNNAGAGWNVPARVGITNGTLAITLTNALAMAASAADACQGATFTVYLAAS